MAMRAVTASVDAVRVPAVATLCIGKHNYTHRTALEQQKSMYTRTQSPHESPTPGADPRDDRPRAARKPGAPRPPSPPARLRGHAGHHFARHQGARPREARRRRRVSAAGDGGDRSGDGADRAGARRERISAERRARPAAGRHPHGPRTGTGARRSAGPRAAERGRRHHCRRRHDSRRRAWRPRRGRAREAVEGVLRGMSRIVLAYSGSLDSSIAIPWLAERHRAEVIAVTMDLGQGKDVLEEVRDRALATGALRAHVVDARDLYLRDYILRGLRAGMLSHRGASMAEALAVPLVAEKLVEIARIEQAAAVAHADRAGRSAAIHRILQAIDGKIDVLAPAGEWDMTATQQIEYAHQRNILLPAALIGGVAVRSAEAMPGEPASVEVNFERGIPIAANGVVMSFGDLIGSLDILTMAHGIDRSALGALHMAHAALRQAALAPDAEEFSTLVADQYVRVLRDGSWFTPLRHALDAFVDAIQLRVGGTVRLKLFTGECAVVSARLSPLQPVT